MAGVCLIKPEYIVQKEKNEETATEEIETNEEKDNDNNNEVNDNGQPPEKKQKLSEKQEKQKKNRGQNKSRKATFHVDRNTELCNTLVDLAEDEVRKECEKQKCDFMHDVEKYLETKPSDIGETCYNFDTFGRCHRGLSCRFAKCHITETCRNCVDFEKYEENKKLQVKSTLSLDLQRKLRKKQYNFDVASETLKKVDEIIKKNKEKLANKTSQLDSSSSQTPDYIETRHEPRNSHLRPLWTADTLALSPLTTVGNLPFRRICKEYGADVTCGEMAMCTSLLQGAPQEWALLKRHHTEDVFGIQLCANNPHLFTKCAQLIIDNDLNVDFVDLNLGCPIDLVYRSGGGCALMQRPRILEASVRAMTAILSPHNVHVTVKMRSGVYGGRSESGNVGSGGNGGGGDQRLAHVLAPKILNEWGGSLVTVHGRTREQRYTRAADWSYVGEVVKAVRGMEKTEFGDGQSGTMVAGNGDILSYDDWSRVREEVPSLGGGVMVGRGALVKPWIFTEIKEKRLWDIRSSERFDLLKKYCNYGLEHWGSDTKGVENTRRFLLEWLSFLYRYVPVALLERPPQKINERPPVYQGRDDLETLMASPSDRDWIAISEMILGRVPDGFHFVPKHRANSYQ